MKLLNLKRLKKFWELYKKSEAISLDDYPQFIETFGTYFGLTTTTEKYQGWIFDCIDIWGKNLAKVNFRLYEIKEDKSEEEILSHPILDIFNRPNSFQTFWEIKYKIAQHISLYGNVFILKLKDGLNIPRQWLLLNPGRVRIITKQSSISHYEYFTNRKFTFDVEDIIHLRYPDPDNDIKGRAIVSNILNQAEIDRLQTYYQKRFYKEGGFMGLTFSTPNRMDDKSFERTKNILQEKYGGEERAFKVALLTDGLEPVKSGYTMKEMEIKPQRELTRDEICSAFQVPKILLGISEAINRATADASIYQFNANVIEPYLSYMDAVFTYDVQKEFGNEYKIKHDTIITRDMEWILKQYDLFLKYGVLSINEIRELEGWSPIQDKKYNIPQPVKEKKF